MKLYYDTRSKIVHGLKLRPANQAVIADSRPLRQLARRVLVGYVRIATSGVHRNSEHLKEELDTTLGHVEHREGLRRFAGLLKTCE